MKNTEDRRTLLPKLRFPEFLSAEGWNEGKLDELVTTVSPQCSEVKEIGINS